MEQQESGLPPASIIRFASDSAEETLETGLWLGARLCPRMVIALEGELGAGKTQLTRGIALGLGVSDPSLVTSPTFVLLQEYTGAIPVYHMDAYRLSSPAEILDIGASELFEEEAVCVVEWADRVADALPRDHLEIQIRFGEEPTSRSILVHAQGPETSKWLRRVAKLIPQSELRYQIQQS